MEPKSPGDGCPGSAHLERELLWETVGGEAIAGKVKSLRKGLRDKTSKRPVYLVLL